MVSIALEWFKLIRHKELHSLWQLHLSLSIWKNTILSLGVEICILCAEVLETLDRNMAPVQIPGRYFQCLHSANSLISVRTHTFLLLSGNYRKM